MSEELKVGGVRAELVLDDKQFKQAMKQAKVVNIELGNELKKTALESKKLSLEAQNVANSERLATIEIKKQAAELRLQTMQMRESAKESQNASNSLRNFAQGGGLASSSIGKLGQFASLAGLGMIGLAGALIGVTGNAIKAAANFEQTNIALEVLIGNTEKAHELLQQIQDMDAKTPFTSEELLNASKTMLGFGVELKKVIPYLDAISNVAAGDAEKLKLLTLAFSQVQSAGKLTGQDLLQMVNSGFNPLQEISERTGVSMAVLKERMEKGAISADMVAYAFKSATSEGGRFYNMNKEESETVIGLWSTLRSDIQKATIAFGKFFEPVTKGTLKILIKSLEDMEKVFNRLGASQRKAVGFTNLKSIDEEIAATKKRAASVRDISAAYNQQIERLKQLQSQRAKIIANEKKGDTDTRPSRPIDTNLRGQILSFSGGNAKTNNLPSVSSFPVISERKTQQDEIKRQQQQEAKEELENVKRVQELAARLKLERAEKFNQQYNASVINLLRYSAEKIAKEQLKIDKIGLTDENYNERLNVETEFQEKLAKIKSEWGEKSAETLTLIQNAQKEKDLANANIQEKTLQDLANKKEQDEKDRLERIKGYWANMANDIATGQFNMANAVYQASQFMTRSFIGGLIAMANAKKRSAMFDLLMTAKKSAGDGWNAGMQYGLLAPVMAPTLAIAGAAFPLAQLAFVASQSIPKFHSGGYIPGTKDTVVMAQGGERILNRAETAQYNQNNGQANSNQPIIVNNYNIKALDSQDVQQALRKEQKFIAQQNADSYKRNVGGFRTALQGA